MRGALGVMAAVAAALFAIHADRVLLTNDEGIILDAARRMVQGQRMYVDFFTYMSPGSYWLQAAVFRVFGLSLAAGRAVVILDLAIQCGLIYWLVERLVSRRGAWAAAGLFFVFELNPESLTAQHRWDSATLILAAVCCLLTRRWMAAGALTAFGAVCTPAAGLAGAAAAIWIVWRRESRGGLAGFAAGGAGVGLVCGAVLAGTGTLGGFLGQLAWLKSHYSTMNAMPYGAIIGGYGPLFEGAGGFDWLVRAALVGCVALPAIAPVAAVLFWAAASARARKIDPELALLALTGSAMALTAFPRADVAHLAFVAAVPTVLLAAGLARTMPVGVNAGLVGGLSLFGLAFAGHFAQQAFGRTMVDSPVGRVALAADQADLAELTRIAPPGTGMFVHPYMPVLYFFAKTNSPSRFSYLAPGMMREAEEETAIGELSAHPPPVVMLLELTREEYLRVFPAARGFDHRYPKLEAWIHGRYRRRVPAVRVAGYELWEPVTSSASPEAYRKPPGSRPPSSTGP